tara:strand:- start:3312 stop:4238 length:927 start_codon:yes stop_codon:yes gene_type:complete
MVFVSGARTSGGTDLDDYISLWDRLIPFSTDTYIGDYSYWEPGLRLFLSTIKGIYNNQSFYLSVVALLIHLLFIIGIMKIKGNPLMALLIFYFSFFVAYTLNAYAQAFAMIFFIFLLPLIYQGRIFLYSLMIISFTFFHKSVLSIFPVLILGRYVKTVRSFSLTLILAIIFSQLGFVDTLISMAGFPIELIPSSYFESSIGILDFLHKGILLIFCYFCVVKITKSDFDWFVLKLYSLAFPIYILFMEMPIMATRFYLFFRILEIVILSRTFEKLTNNINKLIYLLLAFILYLPGFYIQITHPDSILGF